MIKQRNHTGLPLVCVQLMTHSGDLHLLPRAASSIMAQDLSHDDIEIQVVFDGTPTEAQWKELEAAFSGFKGASLAIGSQPPFERVTFVATPEKNGYYCVPRNQALPAIRAPYIAFMDADNEMAPTHLSGLLAAIRLPHPDRGIPHFVYSRRKYVIDGEAKKGPVSVDQLKEGDSPLVPWTPENAKKLMETPQRNFVDTGDFMVGKSTLYRLAELTGCVWNGECRRFGDWDLVSRMAGQGFKGLAVNQATNIYHWTGKNLQLTREPSEVMIIPAKVFNKLMDEGKVKM